MTTAPPGDAPTRDDAPPRLDRLIRKTDLPAYTGLHRTQIAKKIADDEFPAPVLLTDSGRTVAWLESEIVKWQQGRIAARERARAGQESTGAARPEADVRRRPVIANRRGESKPSKGEAPRGKHQPVTP